MIAELERKGAQLEKAAKVKRSRLGRNRFEREHGGFHEVHRIGRILFFLRHGIPADGSTDKDFALDDLLQEKLRTRGE